MVLDRIASERDRQVASCHRMGYTMAAWANEHSWRRRDDRVL